MQALGSKMQVGAFAGVKAVKARPPISLSLGSGSTGPGAASERAARPQATRAVTMMAKATKKAASVESAWRAPSCLPDDGRPPPAAAAARARPGLRLRAAAARARLRLPGRGPLRGVRSAAGVRSAYPVLSRSAGTGRAPLPLTASP